MHLSKGTIVKHGTSLHRFIEIIQNGFAPDSKRNQIRIETEDAPIVSGTYIAKNLAYYGAAAAFTSSMYLHNQQGLNIGDIPIVLNIQLQEDCLVLADEDYVFEESEKNIAGLEKHSEAVWRKYETGVIPDKTIPSDWIKSFEYPMLRESSNIYSNKKYFEEFEKDIWVLVLAYWQNKTQATVHEFDDMLKQFMVKNSYRHSLANTPSLSQSTIDQFLKLNLLHNQSKFHEYSSSLWRRFTFRLHELGLEYNS